MITFALGLYCGLSYWAGWYMMGSRFSLVWLLSPIIAPLAIAAMWLFG